MPKKTPPLFTIGYEKALPAAVLRELKHAKIYFKGPVIQIQIGEPRPISQALK